MSRVLVVVTLLAAAGVARADVSTASWVHDGAEFAPTRSSSGTPLRWARSCVFLRPHAAGAADVPGGFDAAIAAAAVGWEDATRACGYLQLQLEPAEPCEVGLDYVNCIVVREDRWCRPAQDGQPERCHDPSAAAITTLFFVDDPGSPDDGVIVDADIEINAVDYGLAVCGDQPGCTSTGGGVVTDLQNVVTHELGHLLGLDHTCWAGPPGAGPLDGDGVPVPPCAPESALPPEVTGATMYNFTDPGEIEKRTPEPDDVDGFCDAYPLAADPMICEPVPAPDPPDPDPPDDGGGCSTGGTPTLGAAVVLVLGLARRRRRRAISTTARCPSG
jgi:MYXO-CTERM domain-containing protein